MMNKRSSFSIFALLLALLGYIAYLYRRSLLGRVLKLPAPLYDVTVERDIPVTMADGIRLFTDHYAPQGEGDFPTILIRTPYGRGKEVALWGGYALGEMPAQRFAERGYHVVVQGARGCLDSEGAFVPHVNEAADGQATVEWIGRQPWFNGVLGTWGPSYLGYMQWATAAGKPTSLKGMLLMVTSSENFTVSHPDGAFGLETRLRWSQGINLMQKTHGRPLRETLAQRLFGKGEQNLLSAFDHLPLLEADTVAAGEAIPFYRSILSHTQEDDPFWTTRDHSDRVVQVTAPMHFVGGWYDYYLRGLLRDYATQRDAGRRPYLTIGPWHHGHPQGLMTGLREGVTWLDAQLKGDRRYLRQKPVRLFVMGSNMWRELDSYPPPAGQRRYYLQAGSGLETEPATESPPDHYRYDPNDPTPALGGAILGFKGAGPQDNGPLEARSDVLCYSTRPLAEDVEVIGLVNLELFVQSSLEHTDFFGRLCDVSPDGVSTNICDGLFRIEPGRGERLPEGKVRIEIDMWATAHRFRQGHQVRLQLSSGAHPRWSRNLGTGEDVATGINMAVAEQSIYHDENHPSALVLPVVEEIDLN